MANQLPSTPAALEELAVAGWKMLEEGIGR